MIIGGRPVLELSGAHNEGTGWLDQPDPRSSEFIGKLIF